MRTGKFAQVIAAILGLAVLIGGLALADLTDAGGAGTALAILVGGTVGGLLVAMTQPLH